MIQFDLRICFKLGWFNRQKKGSVPKNGGPAVVGSNHCRIPSAFGTAAFASRYARSRFEERTNERDTFDATVLMERFGQVPGGDPGVVGEPQDGKGKNCKLSNVYYLLRDC